MLVRCRETFFVAVAGSGLIRGAESEPVPDRQRRLGLVHGIEMQARRAHLEQALTQSRDDLGAERPDAVDVVAKGLQAFTQPTWDLCAAAV